MSQNNKPKEKFYWRSADQLADNKIYRQFLEREFPEGASEFDNRWSRRNFITLMGASMALAGIAGCRKPKEKIVPYVRQPEEILPGVPQHYATTMPFGNEPLGIVVESHEGRPTKIEGNKLHPSSSGATNTYAQASILNLYDPDRSRFVLQDGAEKTWDDFISFWRTKSEEFKADKGAKLAILSEAFASPSMARLKKEFEKAYPEASWVTYEPLDSDQLLDGVKKVTGEDVRPVYHYDKAEVILSVGADFVNGEPDNVRAMSGFASRRKIADENETMNRLYVVESAHTSTGAAADHRLRLKTHRMPSFLVSLAKELSRQGLKIDAVNSLASDYDDERGWLKPLAADLIRNKGRSLVVAGSRLWPEVHALATAINEALDNNGKTVEYVSVENSTRTDVAALDQLLARNGDDLDTLVILGGNPLYNMPADKRFEPWLKKIKNSIHLSESINETSAVTSWHIARTHYLESWSDARSANGTLSIVQPLIEPLFAGHSDVELLSLLIDGTDRRGYDIVRATWQKLIKGDLESNWRRVLHDGLLADSAAKPKKIKIKNDYFKNDFNVAQYLSKADGIEVHFAPSVLYDGRFSNNGWMQELPDPVSKITWDNAALVSPTTARKLNVSNQDVVTLTLGNHTVEAPIWEIPGQADDVVVLPLGYGRTRGGRVADKVGFNAGALQSLSNRYVAAGLSVAPTGRTYKIASTQDHGSMEGRPLLREATAEEYKKHPEFAKEMVEHPPLESMWDDLPKKEGYQWGMVIDLNSCIGCNACTVACQSENNIPIVGKKQVLNGREMHWIRLDRYYSDDENDPGMVHQPVTCMQCELAPCEQVCPVAATTHDSEGLNVMTYNRCIGTRYCSNNCPYKVRRFNFFNYTNELPEVVKMAQNPDVTVRSRGVMEKCTYCTQRINRARIDAKKENREIQDGEFETACQQVCPAKAITFGNIANPESEVTKLKKQNRNYDMLGELNIRPRTSYLARIRNINPEMPKG